ncbi:tautomerase family protein [Poseidonibacter lekithochrous]|uniref:tautomerase family protein n=1 Tax=Poseidonibacter lekithochrous TaxID=1904463 RepID=UPI0008FC8D64|nr:tautomerase family protein [Poseidonibacter lekithochrous]QKJ24229.1 4-oxalocrotonate tautomerase family enzyme [Poseidonibacter lekithochrous]
MPYINVKTNVKKSDELREKIVDIILENTTNILNKKPEVTSVLVEFVPFDTWNINKDNLSTFNVDIKITKGTNTKNQKAQYIKETYLNLKEILGDITPASYIIIDEIEGDSWGFEGLTQEYRYIKG